MPDIGTQSEYWDDSHRNDLAAGGVTVAEFQTEEECSFAAYLLAEGGVQSAVAVPERRLDLRLPQVRVAPDDEALARRILAQPITAEKRAQYDAEPDCEPFVTPRCPRCASPEVVLEYVANGNSWRCDICGNRWSEIPEVADA
jgi:hypothetical protein